MGQHDGTALAHRPRHPAKDAAPAEVVTDPAEAAKAAGLRYVADTMPGIRRLRQGKGFRYVTPDGKPLRDPDALARIRSLVIPPAWTDVWICPLAHGHLQATGVDARKRKQYRYHPRWRTARDETKFDRMLAFGQALPRIRKRIAKDLALTGLPRRKVLATVVRLLEMQIGEAVPGYGPKPAGIGQGADGESHSKLLEFPSE